MNYGIDEIKYLNAKLQKLIECRTLLERTTEAIEYSNMLKECELGIITKEEVKDSNLYTRVHKNRMRLK